jgi:hypothetical protein
MRTPLISLLMVAALLVGCATTEDFAPYTGTKRDWPTLSSGARVKDYNGVQVIHGLPAKPYDVVGKLSVVDPVDEYLAVIAKNHGLDAVVLTDSPLMKDSDVALSGERTTSLGYGAPGYQSPGVTPPAAHTVVTAWFIKYRTGP